MSEKLKSVRDRPTILLRVPDELREQLERRARAKGRSMNAEAISILSAYLELPKDAELEALETELRYLEDEVHNAGRTLNLATDRRNRLRNLLAQMRSMKPGDAHPRIGETEAKKG